MTFEITIQDVENIFKMIELTKIVCAESREIRKDRDALHYENMRLRKILDENNVD